MRLPTLSWNSNTEGRIGYRFFFPPDRPVFHPFSLGPPLSGPIGWSHELFLSEDFFLLKLLLRSHGSSKRRIVLTHWPSTPAPLPSPFPFSRQFFGIVNQFPFSPVLGRVSVDRSFFSIWFYQSFIFSVTLICPIWCSPFSFSRLLVVFVEIFVRFLPPLFDSVGICL